MARFAAHGIHVRSIEPFADFHGPNRSKVIRRDEADDLIDLGGPPDPRKRRGRRLSGKAVAPSGAVKHPTEIDPRPRSRRMVEADAADHVSRRVLDDTPLTISADLPLADHVVAVLPREIEAARRVEQRDLFPLDAPAYR